MDYKKVLPPWQDVGRCEPPVLPPPRSRAHLWGAGTGPLEGKPRWGVGGSFPSLHERRSPWTWVGQGGLGGEERGDKETLDVGASPRGALSVLGRLIETRQFPG